MLGILCPRYVVRVTRQVTPERVISHSVKCYLQRSSVADATIVTDVVAWVVACTNATEYVTQERVAVVVAELLPVGLTVLKVAHGLISFDRILIISKLTLIRKSIFALVTLCKRLRSDTGAKKVNLYLSIKIYEYLNI